jgi:hypothetical protein
LPNRTTTPPFARFGKKGLNGGKERAFYPGVVHDLYKVRNPDQAEHYIIAINSPAFISTEGYHYVSLCDVNGPPVPGTVKTNRWQSISRSAVPHKTQTTAEVTKGKTVVGSRSLRRNWFGFFGGQHQ